MKWHPAISNWDGSIGLLSAAPTLELPEGSDSPGQDDEARPTFFSVCVANTEPRREQASALVAKAYGQRGYDVSFLDEEPQPQEKLLTLLFSINCRPEGTYSIRLDTQDGLLTDHTFEEELAALRAGGRTVIELCRFASDPSLPAGVAGHLTALQLQVLVMLSKQFCYTPTTLVIEVDPHHVRIWRGLGWTRSTGERWCDRVNAASVLMWIDCAEFVARSDALLQRAKETPSWNRLQRFTAQKVHAMTTQLYEGIAHGALVERATAA